jgi:glycosyltransferase involved in cell wall biosynthesis
VVATDCPNGRDETLTHERFGKLVPVGEAKAMAEAIRQALRRPYGTCLGSEHSMVFSLDNAAEKYLLLFQSLIEIKRHFSG